jgi:predicted  nucleic acid-binding Zn-ribbon protein
MQNIYIKRLEDSLDVDIMKNINDLLTVVEDIKLSVSKHEISFRDVNEKLDSVPKELRYLSNCTLSLENRAD